MTISQMQREFDPMLRPDLIETAPRFLMHWISGALLTMGEYPSAEMAKQACGEVGKWIEMGSEWRSEDGRWLIVAGKVF